MAEYPNLSELSQAELDAYLDELVRRGDDERDSPEWRRAYTFWETQ